MRRTLRLTLVIALTLSLALLAGCGSGGDPNSSASGLPKELVIGAAIAKSGYLVPYNANIAAVEQLVKETNAGGGRIDQFGFQETWEHLGTKLATALEAKPHPTVMGPLTYTRDDHLPSEPWYIYEYPDRKPKLLERVKPAYVPEYEQLGHSVS